MSGPPGWLVVVIAAAAVTLPPAAAVLVRRRLRARPRDNRPVNAAAAGAFFGTQLLIAVAVVALSRLMTR